MLQGASRWVLVAENGVLDALCGLCAGFILANQYSRRCSSASDLGPKSTLVVIIESDVEPKTAKGWSTFVHDILTRKSQKVVIADETFIRAFRGPCRTSKPIIWASPDTCAMPMRRDLMKTPGVRGQSIKNDRDGRYNSYSASRAAKVGVSNSMESLEPRKLRLPHTLAASIPICPVELKAGPVATIEACKCCQGGRIMINA